MFTSSQLYFGTQPGCLDIFTLRYRWFGAVWKYEGNHQIVLGFWFGDNKRALLNKHTVQVGVPLSIQTIQRPFVPYMNIFEIGRGNSIGVSDRVWRSTRHS